MGRDEITRLAPPTYRKIPSRRNTLNETDYLDGLGNPDPSGIKYY